MEFCIMEWDRATGWIGIGISLWVGLGAAWFPEQIKQGPCVTKKLWWAVRFWANIDDHLWRMRNIYNFINIGSMSQRRPTSNYYTVWSYDCFNVPTQKIIFLNAHHNFCLGSFNVYFCKEMPFLVFCSWKLNTLEDQRDLKLDRVCVSPKSFQTQKSKTRN